MLRNKTYAKISLGLATFFVLWLTFVPATVTKRRASAASARSEASAARPGILERAHALVPANSSLASQTLAVKSYEQLPLSFEANHGQTGPQVKFLARGRGYTLFLTSNEAVLALKKPEVRSPKPAPAGQMPAVRGQLQKAITS